MSLKITWVTPTRMARLKEGQIIKMWQGYGEIDLNTRIMLVRI